MPQITNLDTSSALPLWNNFIISLPAPVPFSYNPSLFSFYQTCFHWKPYYFFLYSEEKLVAVFPLVNTGKRWVSLPHFSYGGLLVLPEFEVDIEKLVCNLIFIIEKKQITPGFYKYELNVPENFCLSKSKVYIRSPEPVKNKSKYQKVSSFLDLPANGNELFQQLSSNLRRKIRKAEKGKITIIHGKEKLLNNFYSVYSHNMLRLGSPAYDKSFFRQLLKVYDYGEARLFISYKQKVAIGAALLLSYNGFWENAWFSTCREGHKDYVSDHLHWEMIQYAIKKKAKIYSFGRSSKGGTVYRYKNHWPVQNVPLFEYSSNRFFSIKDHQWLAKIWKHLPYTFTRLIGPLMIKHIY